MYEIGAKLIDYFDDRGMIGGELGYIKAGRDIGEIFYYVLVSHKVEKGN